MTKEKMEENNSKNGESPHFIQEKRKLLRMASHQYESELKDQVNEMSKNVRRNASQWGKNLAVVGGTLFVAYQFFRKVSTPPKQEIENYHQVLVEEAEQEPPQEMPVRKIRKKKKSSRKSRLMESVKQNIALILLSAAQQKLLEFLEKQHSHEQAPSSDSAKPEGQ